MDLKTEQNSFACYDTTLVPSHVSKSAEFEGVRRWLHSLRHIIEFVVFKPGKNFSNDPLLAFPCCITVEKTKWLPLSVTVQSKNIPI